MRKKFYAILIIIISIFIINVNAEELNGLVEIDGNTYYYKDGVKQVGFQEIDGKYYFFSRIGLNQMRTGTFKIDGVEHTFGDDGVAYDGLLTINGEKYYYKKGVKQKGLQEIDGKYYFFSRIGSNQMRMGTFKIDGVEHSFDINGIAYDGLLTINGEKYYYKKGVKQKGLQLIDGKYYFFSRIGSNQMRIGTFSIDGVEHTFGSDGAAYDGIITIGSDKYYYKKGVKQKGLQVIDGNTYFFSRIGSNQMRYGFFKIDNYYYYFDEVTGVAKNGYQTVEGKQKYFLSNGRMAVGITIIDDVKYYFDKNGDMAYGFQEEAGNTYFFTRISDHRMRCGFFKIDDYYYYFDEITGIMQKGFKIVDGKKRFFSRLNGQMRTGWVKIDGYMHYFYPATGEMAVGEVTIDGVKYTFKSDGKVKDGFVTDSNGNTKYIYADGSYAKDWVTLVGVKHFFNSQGILIGRDVKKVIDVSYWQTSIDWNKVAKEGKVDGAMVRAGYRGYGTGKIVEDDTFAANVNGAHSNGLSVGVYFYSQAINEKEAIEEANKTISMINSVGKSKINMPVAFDTEFTDCRCGRADNLSKSQRTAIAKAFLQKIQKAGFTPVLYASTNFLYNQLDMSQLSTYKVWVAQYNTTCTYDGPGNKMMWQYTSKGLIPGINGNVDIDVWWK